MVSRRVWSRWTWTVRRLLAVALMALVGGCSSPVPPVTPSASPSLLLVPPFEVASPAPVVPSAPAASSSPAPAGSPSQATPAPANVDCGDVGSDDCLAMVAEALGSDIGAFSAVRVEDYVPGCMRAGLCSPPFGGYDARYLVAGVDAAGARHGWACSIGAQGASCRLAAAEDVEPLATLVLRIKGVARQDVVLLQGGTTWSWTAQSVGSRKLTVGTWQLATSNAACDACQQITPPFAGTPPPDWCSLTFQADPAAQVTLSITIRRGAMCTIERTDG